VWVSTKVKSDLCNSKENRQNERPERMAVTICRISKQKQRNDPRKQRTFSRTYLEFKLIYILSLLFDELMRPLPECHNS